MPVKFGQMSIRFCFFLSYLITTVQKFRRFEDTKKYFRNKLTFSTCHINIRSLKGQDRHQQPV